MMNKAAAWQQVWEFICTKIEEYLGTKAVSNSDKMGLDGVSSDGEKEDDKAKDRGGRTPATHYSSPS